MRHLCWISIETAKIESMEEAIQRWRQMGRGKVLTDKLNRSENVKDQNEAESKRGDVGVEACGNGDWVDDVVVVSDGCPSEANAVDGAVKAILRRSDINDLNEEKFLEDNVWGNGGMWCEVEQENDFGDPSNGAGADIFEERLYAGCFESRPTCFLRTATMR